MNPRENVSWAPLLLLMLLSWFVFPAGAKCLEKRPDVRPKRYFYFGEQTLDIRIEISGRISHQLASHVLKILLEEVVGYANVTLIRKEDFMNTTVVLNRISGCHNRSSGCKHHHILDQDNYVPETMINLEVWTGPGFNMEEWLTTKLIEDCGPLGPIGRFGWYIPKYMTSNNWEQCDVVDHWRALQDEAIAKNFSMSDDEMIVVQQLTFKSANEHYCNDESCINGIFTPKICERVTDTCATLLSNYADITFGMIRDQIDLLKLRVKVVWIGPHLADFVLQRFTRGKPVLFFNWKPSPITASDNYTHIAFPMCEDLPISFPFPANCEFEINQLEKVAWSELKTATPEAMHVVRALTFSHTQYTALLNNYMNSRDRNKSVSEVACDWVKSNATIWAKWIPNDLSSKTTIYIGGIFPISGINYSSKGIIPAADMAVESVNRNNSVLRDYRLEMLYEDGKCSSDHVMKAYIKYVTIEHFSRIAGILGPACSDTVEPIAGVAKHFNSVIISYSAEGAIPFQDSDEFSLFFRTIPSNRLFKHVYLQLFLRLGWKRVAALTEDGQKYPEYLSSTQDFLQANGINFIANRKFPRERLFMNMSQSLEDLRKKKARIIIGDFYDYAARAVMCEAYKQGMTARSGYVWFLPMWFSKNWYDTDYYNNQSEQLSRSKPIPCSTSEMIQAINGHLSLVYSYYGKDNDVMQEGRTVGEWRKLYKKRVENEIHLEVMGNLGDHQPGVREKRHAEDEISDYAGYAYDAVWVYAYALDELLKQNHSYIATLHTEKTTKKYVDILNRTNFHGVSGHIRFMGPTRLSVINVLQWVANHTQLVGQYIPANLDEGRLELNESSFVWLTPDGTIAGDGSEMPESCALETLRQLLGVECEVAIVVANVFGFGLFALIMILCFIFFKRRYEKKVKLTEARMRELGLTSSTTMLTLDEWEIPRDRVVLNRKLGEGAFGTVYGGEAFFDEKGWVPVAVKTLKAGSTVEEKLDFLSEAEMMKRFDHKNIIQLLGVCTRGEGVYTVMEFMLYGDLKTYLLARRSMVNEKLSEDSDEVSNKRLSAMALDVARGLSYLADLKYVHRDLACRNCLVNSSRTVKIGDFGMTRPMYDSDYYRFNKKGMLPVRWMAPESLADGIFTPLSDVWSFGVLMYEVITFGSFPFQGLSNNQVLDFVKNGNRLRVPSGCKHQLEWLLLSCWSREPRDRPTASEIVEHLANNPRLVTPCLDVPLASVEMEGTGSLEFQLPERPRKFSTSVGNKLANSARRRSGPTENNEMTNAHENTPMISGNGGPLTIDSTKMVPSLHPVHYVTLKDDCKIEDSPKELCQNVTCL